MIELGIPPPIVVGGTGGSGTRAVARILARAGLFLGIELNDSEDAWRFGEYSDRWIDTFLAHGRGELPVSVERMMRDELGRFVAAHRAALPDGHRPWGWKEPRSIYLLPFLRRCVSGLRFLHVVRDGRDMALSSNQNQLRKHGAAAPIPAGLPDAVRSIALWSWINTRAATFGAGELGDDYLLVRYEDLCARPVEAAHAILEFARLSADPAIALDVVTPPASLGRWKTAEPDLVEALERQARAALAAFGYPLRTSR